MSKEKTNKKKIRKKEENRTSGKEECRRKRKVHKNTKE